MIGTLINPSVRASLIAGVCTLAAALTLVPREHPGLGASDVGAPRPNLVSDEDIRKSDNLSPERTLLRWWQAAQLEDLATLMSLTAGRAVQGRAGEVASATHEVARALGKPRVVRRRETGRNRVAVGVVVESFTVGNRKPVAAFPYTFRLTWTGGGWRLADASYLLRSARDIGKVEDG